MVVGVDPPNKAIAIASIPRDTINVPLKNGTVLTNQKINAFYNLARGDPARYPEGPGRATADVVGGMLGIRVDFYAATTFEGFRRLVDAMGGVSIRLPKAISDPYYQVTTRDIGIHFPAGTQTLAGDRALIYVRTRYADNDFERQRRQQAFVVAAGRKVLENPAVVPALIAAVANLTTDLPWTEVPAMLAAYGSFDEWSIRQTVLGPRTYESAASCPCGYALEPKLEAMRKLAAEYYPWAVQP